MTTPQYDPRTQPPVPSPLADPGESQRDYVVQRLSEAFAADRISVDELDARLGMVYRSTSLQQLGQLLEDPANPGWSLEKPLPTARVAEELQGGDRPRLKRMGYEPVTCPTTKNLEDLFYPNPQKIAAAAYSMIHDNGPSWAPRQVDSPEAVQFRGPF